MTTLICVVLALLVLAAAIAVRRRRDASPGAELVQAGSVWFAPVPFEEDRHQVKDRPVLVLGVGAGRVAALMITSKDKSSRAGFVPVSTRAWSAASRTGVSWVRTDRVIWIPMSSLRRQVADDVGARVWWACATRQLMTIALTRGQGSRHR